MKYLFVILAWVMGLLLIFLGLIFMVKTPFAGGLLMLLSLFLLPPVRHYIHIKTNKKISILLISVSIFCLTVLILVLITNERKAAKLKAFTEFSIKDQIIQEEFAKRSKAKALAEVNKTVSLDIENKNNEKSPELAVKKTGSRQVSMSTLNTVISLTNDISLNWDHDVLKKYIESENFIKNEISYQKLFDKHANLGKLKTCSNLGLLGYEQESLFTIKQDCEFENGNAYIQAIFQRKQQIVN